MLLFDLLQIDKDPDIRLDKLFVVGQAILIFLFNLLQIDKDPDIRLDKLFVVGQVMPVQVSTFLRLNYQSLMY